MEVHTSEFIKTSSQQQPTLKSAGDNSNTLRAGYNQLSSYTTGISRSFEFPFTYLSFVFVNIK